MRTGWKRLAAGVATLAMGLALAAAAPKPAEPARGPAAVAPPVTPEGDMVVSHGQVAVDGRPLRYTVHAGLLPIYDNDTGQLAARIFIIAYTADRAPGAAPRPLTFLWNGGPGSSSSQIHLMGFGPKGFSMPATYPEWKAPPAKLADRPETWLTASDLVFVDPVGTGYSRATSEAWRERLYTQHGDAEAVAEAIRVYRTRFDAFDAPLFIGGESYGTTRAMEVAGALARRRTPLSGVILISGSYEVGEKVPAATRQALEVTLYTATAWYHHRLPADLQALPQDQAVARAAAWARSDYAPALAHPDQLSPEQRAAIVAALARYSGVDSKVVDARTLRLGKDAVMDNMLADKGLELGRYDARLAIPHRAPGQVWGPREDPSLLPMIDLMEGTSPALIRYLRGDLGYHSDLLYRGPWGGSFHPDPYLPTGPVLKDDWMAAMWDHHAALNGGRGAGAAAGPPEPPPLAAAMTAEPKLLVWSVEGLYDGSCAERAEAIADSPAPLRARVRASCYPAGHMVYTDRAVRLSLQRDFTAFVHDATAR
ncbi:S10 family serine carboxypeptidase-like protein [Phenylobacterium sp.]|jgi:carboxypeptidase C (cathepsin A)|uniref:S10 family serine carboxypeptidase-like protein n=1 Tax=Phenylobacterium sp. TaxID=1871053 RepID=UPI002F40F567